MIFCFFFFQAEDGIRDGRVTGVQTCALPILSSEHPSRAARFPAVRRPGRPGAAGRDEPRRRRPGLGDARRREARRLRPDRKSTRLNSSHPSISYAVFCLKKKKKKKKNHMTET